jgi:hypothetical protein
MGLREFFAVVPGLEDWRFALATPSHFESATKVAHSQSKTPVPSFLGTSAVAFR